MRTFLMVHNIPTPYRLHLFRVLNRGLRDRGIQFHVAFMARGHRDRPASWVAEGDELGFSHSFHTDIGPTIRGKEWHLNPGLFTSAAWREAEVVCLGGVWDSLTAVALTLLDRARVRIAFIEGNTSTPGKVDGAAGYAKQKLLKRFDFLAVPGEEGVKYAELVLGETLGRRKAILPNIVDETRFRQKDTYRDRDRAVIRARWGLGETDRLAIWPARLIPNKGVVEFISQLTPADLRGWKLVILGEGPLREPISRQLPEQGLESYVRVLPYETYDSMPAVYAAADLMVLPSFKDPNPLSIIEAMHAGLPLLVSRRIGNYPEAMEGTTTGWGLDPDSPGSVRSAVRAAFGATTPELRERGRLAAERAAEVWDSTRAVDSFLRTVLPTA